LNLMHNSINFLYRRFFHHFYILHSRKIRHGERLKKPFSINSHSNVTDCDTNQKGL
jgi:hypothetical protein